MKCVAERNKEVRISRKMMEKKWQWKKVHIVALLAFLYVGCLVVLSFIGYSDGDDAFFLEYCGSMGFFEYLQWRYATWTGRMASEGMMHIFFNLGLWEWRIVNAGMLVALPVALVVLKNRVVSVNEEMPENDRNRRLFVSLVMAMLFYLLLDIKAFGYSAIWVTGSMNYLWPMVCGIVALSVVANVAFAVEKGNGVAVWKFVTASVCAVIATMSSEQMGAVLLAFEIICIAEKLWKKHSVGAGMFAMTAATVGAFLISSLSPGNELRIAAAVEHNMPQFETLSIGERGFILIQWLVSSFANENGVFLMAIWLVGILLLLGKGKEEKMLGKELLRTKVYLICSSVFLGVAVIGKCGLKTVNNLGINLAEMAGLVEQVPQAADMSMVQWAVLVWWILALLFTLFFLWEVSKGNGLILLTYLGAIASEVILIFSPTIYSSGERVFFLTGLMLLFIVMVLYEALPMRKVRTVYVSMLVVLGIGNLLLQAKEMLAMIQG